MSGTDFFYSYSYGILYSVSFRASVPSGRTLTAEELAMGFLTRLFGSYSDRELKRIYPIADKIEKLAPAMQALTDSELRDKT